jgi:uncharacterized membrane protein SirB2
MEDMRARGKRKELGTEQKMKNRNDKNVLKLSNNKNNSGKMKNGLCVCLCFQFNEFLMENRSMLSKVCDIVCYIFLKFIFADREGYMRTMSRIF